VQLTAELRVDCNSRVTSVAYSLQLRSKNRGGRNAPELWPTCIGMGRFGPEYAKTLIAMIGILKFRSQVSQNFAWFDFGKARIK
jgi:hypothetical protein